MTTDSIRNLNPPSIAPDIDAFKSYKKFEEKVRGSDEDLLEFLNEWEFLYNRSGVIIYDRTLAFKLISACNLTETNQNFVIIEAKTNFIDGHVFDRTKTVITTILASKVEREKKVRTKITEIIESFHEDIDKEEVSIRAYEVYEKLESKTRKPIPIQLVSSLALCEALGDQNRTEDFVKHSGINTPAFLKYMEKVKEALALPVSQPTPEPEPYQGEKLRSLLQSLTKPYSRPLQDLSNRPTTSNPVWYEVPPSELKKQLKSVPKEDIPIDVKIYMNGDGGKRRKITRNEGLSNKKIMSLL